MKKPLQRHDEDSSKKINVDPEEGTTCSTVEGVSEAEADEKEGMMEFDVFLSFRGKDTRKGFTGHLYADLKQRGVSVFIDSEDLRKGKKIDLLARILQVSKIFLPVFSQGYAESKWCLREIAKAVECGKKILPVFFNVEPSDVRRQSGERFKRAFEKHESNEELEKEEVRSWRAALQKAGSISGYHFQNDARGDEAKLIPVIVKDVMTCVRTNPLKAAKHPVGLKPLLEIIKEKLGLQDLEGDGVVRMVGIIGMGGIGKTTLAKAVCDQIAGNFEACSFLFDVGETSNTAQGLQSLQAQMIRDISGQNNEEQGIHNVTIKRGAEAIKKVASCKKVLVVLDDVDHWHQLKALAGGVDWFGKGSRIIITTRDKRVLKGHGIEESNINMYEIDRLNRDDSMELFCYHAFRSNQPPNERYKWLAMEVVSTAGGLSLALEVLGAQFFDMKTPNEWEALIKKLKKYQSEDIHDWLRISYDELDVCEKEVFLDIACFFVGRDKEYPMLMWEACEFHPSVAIKVLVHKSLIKMTTGYNKQHLSEEEVFSMHDQIREMGRNIVLQERGSLMYLSGRRSRFWNTTTTLVDELQTMEEPKSVQGIELSWREKIPIPANFWERHTQQRYLHGDGVTFQGNRLQLPDPLKWLSLTDCELEQPSTYDFAPGERIVILELYKCSHLARSFVEQSFLSRRKGFEKLKVLDLSWSSITTTPDFSNVPCPNLEKMILFFCQELTSIHESIGLLKRLEILDLEGCTQLSSLPITLGDMTSLKNLILEACEKLSSLPNTFGGMTSLEVLVLKRTNIDSLPHSIGDLRNLEKLSLDYCVKLSSLPNTLRGMTSLEMLMLNGTDITTLPDSIGELGNLKKLSIADCGKLSSLPNTLGGMTSLEKLVLNRTVVETLPRSIGKLRNLKQLSLDHCFKLSSLPNTLGGMTSLEKLVYRRRNPTDSVGELKNLKKTST